MNPLRILQICTYDQAGGAEQIALGLHRAYRALGHDARLIVRDRRTDEAGVVELDAYAGTAPWAGACATLADWLAELPQVRGRARLQDWLRRTAWPQRWIDRMRGADDFNYPAAHRLADGDWQPDCIHAHNLHGDYFDLRALATLSRRRAVIWTLHDAWALTGHCAYPISCPRWLSGCGRCPDLRRPPAIRRDHTAENWRRKGQIYAQSRLAVATPSRWLMDLVDQSMLQPWQQRVIPNGVDRAVFAPGDQAAARVELGLPADALIAVFVALSVSPGNPYKDIVTVLRTLELARGAGRPIVGVGVGEAGKRPAAGLRYTGYLHDPRLVARYYQAADVLIHASNADTAPCVIAEALACGTPVIATAVGGVPEQLADGQTGRLVPRGDAAAMAAHLRSLADQPALLADLRQAARAQAIAIPDLVRQAEDYLGWFAELAASCGEGMTWMFG